MSCPKASPKQTVFLSASLVLVSLCLCTHEKCPLVHPMTKNKSPSAGLGTSPGLPSLESCFFSQATASQTQYELTRVATTRIGQESWV